MSSYILIVMWSVAGSQAAVAMQEFGSLAACQFASVQIAERKQGQFTPSMVCVPKEQK